MSRGGGGEGAIRAAERTPAMEPRGPSEAPEQWPVPRPASGEWASFHPVSVVVVVIVITSRLSSFSSHAHLRHGCRLFCRRSGHAGDREGPAGLGRPTPVEICGPLDVFLTERW